MRLEPTRIEDVPVPELSGLALSTGRAGRPKLLAIGDRKTVLAQATLTEDPLDWSALLLCETPLVHVLDLDTERAETIAPEGLVVTDGTLLVGLDTKQPTANLCWYDRP